MLNRRILRIKAMQALFAKENVDHAIYSLAKDSIDNFFSPNLMLEIPQDRKLLEKQKKEAQKLFDEWQKNNVISESDDPEVNKACEEAIEYQKKEILKQKNAIRNEMVKEVEELYFIFIYILNLIIHIGKLSEKHYGEDNNFIHNSLLRKIKDNKDFIKHNQFAKTSILNDLDKIKEFYREYIKENASFVSYQKNKKINENDDVEILQTIIKDVIFNEEIILDFFEEKDIRWAENKSIVRGMLKKTLKDFDNIGLVNLTQDWDDDKQFFLLLFDETVKNEIYFNELIVKYAKNWKLERIALLDNVIIKLGIAEMIAFSSIPVKVSINEYIDISKLYSTPKSKQFINGMLDKISQELIENGTIKKTGRGLIDNK